MHGERLGSALESIILTLFGRKIEGEDSYTTFTSDPTHFSKKWSLAFFSGAKLLYLGYYPVVYTALCQVQMDHPECGLRARDVNGADRMDYSAAKRRLNFTVRESLEKLPAEQSKGLIVYLAICDCVDIAVFDKKIPMELRWRLI